MNIQSIVYYLFIMLWFESIALVILVMQKKDDPRLPQLIFFYLGPDSIIWLKDLLHPHQILDLKYNL